VSKKYLKVSQNKNLLRVFLLICLGLFFAMTVLLFSSTSYAEDDLSFAELAREKKYIGGVDESDLKIIATLPSVKSKKIKTEEAEEGF
jgi:hypothetical protein